MSEVQASATGGEGSTATTAATTATAQTAAPAAPTWLGDADEVTVGYVQNKGWTEPKQVLEGYRNLEKLLGADKAGNAVVMPKPDAQQAELDAFYNRLGRPSDAAGYKIAVPEGGNADFAKAAAGKFHELGLTSKQGEALSAWWNESAGAQTAATQAAKASAFQADDAALKTAWGAAYQQNLTAAQTAVRGLGLDNATIDKLADAMGHKATMEFFQKIGSKVGESDFVTGDKLENFGSALTPGQAKAKISDLMRDKNFTARYLSRDADAKAEMERLHKFAYPEE